MRVPLKLPVPLTVTSSVPVPPVRVPMLLKFIDPLASVRLPASLALIAQLLATLLPVKLFAPVRPPFSVPLRVPVPLTV